LFEHISGLEIAAFVMAISPIVFGQGVLRIFGVIAMVLAAALALIHHG
jgi:hypothetical protein